MGGYITGKPSSVDYVLVEELRRIPLLSVTSVLEYFEDNYPETYKVPMDVYEKLFSDILVRWEVLGKKLVDKDGNIDVYEAFSVFFTFSDGLFEPKVKELFKLFDFDGSGEIDFAELFLALQSTINGICKLLGLAIPSLSNIRALSLKAIKIIDADENDYIDFDEFYDWIFNDEEIQEFLADNLQYQTRSHALKLYHQFYEKYIKCFYQGMSKGKPTLGKEVKEEVKLENPELVCPRIALKEALMLCKDEWIKEETLDDVLNVVDPSKNGLIKLESYKDAIRAMCSFMATDLNGDHVIQPTELRTLLWLTEGLEPTYRRVMSEKKAMDIDSDGTITMVEWIKYLVTTDPVSGTPYFDFSLKRKFDLYDADNSGSISKDEIFNMLNDTFAECMADLGESMQVTFKGLLEDAANNIIKELDEDGSEVLEWNEFKKSMQTFAKKTDSLKEIINKAKSSAY